MWGQRTKTLRKNILKLDFKSVTESVRSQTLAPKEFQTFEGISYYETGRCDNEIQ